MPCPELIRDPRLGSRFQSHRFKELHGDGRRLVIHWFNRAYQQRSVDPSESFEPFIFAWIAFNGWASCCTEMEYDRDLVEALSASPELVRQFGVMLEEPSCLRTTAERFRSYWPVFRVQELKRLRAPMYLKRDRQATVADYLARGAKRFAPACFQRHTEAGEEIPLDWPHILRAIYQVRCNLFHGDKVPHSEIDRVLVHSAFQILVHFLSRCQYMPQAEDADAIHDGG